MSLFLFNVVFLSCSVGSKVGVLKRDLGVYDYNLIVLTLLNLLNGLLNYGRGIALMYNVGFTVNTHGLISSTLISLTLSLLPIIFIIVCKRSNKYNSFTSMSLAVSMFKVLTIISMLYTIGEFTGLTITFNSLAIALVFLCYNMYKKWCN